MTSVRAEPVRQQAPAFVGASAHRNSNLSSGLRHSRSRAARPVTLPRVARSWQPVRDRDNRSGQTCPLLASETRRDATAVARRSQDVAPSHLDHLGPLQHVHVTFGSHCAVDGVSTPIRCACWALAGLADARIAAAAAMTSRRLVCREKSIVRGEGGRFTTPPPSRLKPHRSLRRQHSCSFDDLIDEQALGWSGSPSPSPRAALKIDGRT